MSGNKGFDDHYKQLEGFKIKQYVGMVDDDGYNGFPKFVLTKRGYKDIAIEVSGTQGFDKTLSYNAVFNVPAKHLGSDVNRLIGSINDTEINNMTIPVTANVGGSYTSPKVKQI